MPQAPQSFGALPEPTEEELAREQRRREAQRKAEKVRLLTEALGGVEAFDRYTFERFRVTNYNTEAHSAMLGFNPSQDNVYLWGKPGTGKTHLALAASRIYFDTNSVKIEKIKKLVRSFRMLDPFIEEHRIKKFVNYEILVLDEFGAIKSSDFNLDIIYEIIDDRLMNRHNGLIITSNLSLDELALKLDDDRIPSRIAGFCKVIKLDGPDHRIKG